MLLVSLLVVSPGSLQAEAELAWGVPNKDGLSTRLVPLEEEHQLGKALTFRLEAKNTGKTTVYCDLQDLAHAGSILMITDRKDGIVPVISANLAGCQTEQSYTAFPPGELVVLAGRIDAAQEFQISRAGPYRFRHPGLDARIPVFKEKMGTVDAEGKPIGAKTRFSKLPASQEVRLEVRGGTLPADLAMIVGLRPIVPKDWFLCRRWVGGGVQIGRHGETGFVRIDLVAVDPKAKVAMEEGFRKLGESPLGEIRMGAVIDDGKRVLKVPEEANLGDYWPGAERAIRKALKVQPSET